MERNKIVSVIVTYYPDFGRVQELISQLKSQNANPIIIDNGTTGLNGWDKLECDVIKLENNLGIAEAQNVGIKKAREMNAEYVLFFDQDSKLNESFVADLFGDYIKTEEEIYPSKIATMGPIFKDERFGFYYPHIILNKIGTREKIKPETKNNPFEVSFIISSGSLVKISVFDIVGIMDSDLFIDYVDTEWCLRAKKMGYKIYASTTASMEHAIGDNVIKFFGFNIPVHSPFRRYYRVRNAVCFIGMPHIPLSIKVRDNIFNFIHQVILFAAVREKGYIKSYFKGVRDGLSIFMNNNKR